MRVYMHIQDLRVSARNPGTAENSLKRSKFIIVYVVRPQGRYLVGFSTKLS